MSSVIKNEEKVLHEFHRYEEDILTYLRLAAERAESPVGRTSMEQEKRIRREIANSNERRRMQSINAGFQSLRTLLPHHEGEKLSKAAILQQTAEYIYQLEQEKTRLLSQNCHLKRLLNQQEGETHPANKKRKADNELGNYNFVPSNKTNDPVGVPKPVLNGADFVTEVELDTEAGSVIDVRNQLDRERRLRMMLEEQVRSLEAQLYPERIREITHKVQLQYKHEDDEIGHGEETEAAVASLQVVSASSLQPVAHTETVIATVTQSPPQSPRLPSILEAAIKAEPKVEVERLPSPSSVSSDTVSQARVYLASTSRQNLETIVEAIRHLEGDNLFSEGAPPEQPQEAPLALTKPGPEKHLLKVKMNQYLQFHQPQPQQRPGVIVVKQNT